MSNSWAVEKVMEVAEDLRRRSGELVEAAEALRDRMGLGWYLPVGTEEYPPEDWYVATVHDPTGRLNGGYRHTGLDINLDKAPWGDVERGFPIWAVADGVVDQVGRSKGWLGVVVVAHSHVGRVLYVRYAHLGEILVDKGEEVLAGDLLGRLGNWETGDHLHFDMAAERFRWNAWLSPGIEWLDPVPVLKEHVDPTLVEAMIQRA